MINKLRIAVLRGGPSNEYDVSMKTGSSVLKNLSPDKYMISDVVISKKGDWVTRGILVKPGKFLMGVDMVINALHGGYGEDGKIQKMLDDFGIPYTGSGSLSSAFGMNKQISKEIYRESGIRTPYSVLLRSDKIEENTINEIFRKFLLPCVVKTVRGGSSIGVKIVKDLAGLKDTINEFSQIYDSILVEEFIEGRETTCGVIEQFRGKEIYSLFPIEIIPPKEKDFFDYESKYDGISQEFSVGRFTKSENEEIQKMAIEAHKVLGLRHYSRSDFIVHPKRGVYILETNTLPGMTEQSLFPKSLAAVGLSLSEFLDHLIKLTVKS